MPIDRPAAAAYVSPLCDAVLDVLSRYTAFPWATLRAACERVGIEPRKLDHRALAELAQPLALQIALFNDVEAAFVLKRELLLLTRAAA
ncbi:MAG: hypothetical protein IPH07_27420 [Deltaproteobacteria bacterium]|nr:hypothetical protein [Deltaproteobacteria bacterium]MBK8240221.1 hypothetical protein [Deltaproteobacteria bacterium]MBK8714624.1 hypothetical protein [Deltaproteobacteria bacterium]MBP7292138.1 hypothetical protein [Nannocystaceae bacterium]